MANHDTLTSELIKTTHYMFDNELAWGNSGNISARTSADHFLITKSGTYLGELAPTDFIEWEIGKEIDRGKKDRPSKEVPMHQAIYEKRPEINAVIHASPLYSTLAACTSLQIPTNSFIEGMYYLERIERIPYAHPGSKELGELVYEKADKTNIILLENHGVLVYDTSLQEAKMGLHTLEFACKMAILSEKNGLPIQNLSPEIVHDFLHHAGYKKKRIWAE